eukprot:199336_1
MSHVLDTIKSEELKDFDRKWAIKCGAYIGAPCLMNIEIPSPKTLENYLENYYEILLIVDESDRMRKELLYKEKKDTIEHWIKMHLKNRDCFVKYLFAFRIFSKQFVCKKAVLLTSVLHEINVESTQDINELIVSFVYDDMSYLKHPTQYQELQFFNHSLEMYVHLSPKWQNWIYDNYILRLPKHELVQLKSFAYLCFL